MDKGESVAYRRVLCQLVHTDNVSERTYLLESDRIEIEKVLNENDRVSAANRHAFSPNKKRI